MRAADYDARSVLAARQRIRTELAKALAEGRLTPLDQYRILLEAREVLPPEDLLGLERTMNRLAAAQEPGDSAHVRLAATGAVGQEVVAPGTPSPLPGTKFEAPDGTVVSESPFVEEQYGEAAGMSLDDQIARQCQCHCQPAPMPCHDEMVEKDRYLNLDVRTGIDGFKGPMDLADEDGNFGAMIGLNGGIPLLPWAGLGFQAGANIIWTDFHGFSQYNDHGSRDQDFASFGLFQRIPWRGGNLAWGFTSDWLFDHYYANTVFSQWRIKLAWEANPWNEFGGWATIRERGATATLGDFTVHFRSMDQGTWYWRHTWCNDVSLTARIGTAQFPGVLLLGADGRVPITPKIALTSSFTYVIPSTQGIKGAFPLGGGAAEIWDLSMGLEFVTGGFRRGLPGRFTPVLPVADNSNMLIRGRM
jgi:hypothetical protein